MKNYRIDYELSPLAKLVIDFDYTPGRPGRMYLRNGDPGYPPDPEERSINVVELMVRSSITGDDWRSVSDDMMYYIRDEIIDNHIDSFLERMQDEAAALRDERERGFA